MINPNSTARGSKWGGIYGASLAVLCGLFLGAVWGNVPLNGTEAVAPNAMTAFLTAGVIGATVALPFGAGLGALTGWVVGYFAASPDEGVADGTIHGLAVGAVSGAMGGLSAGFVGGCLRCAGVSLSQVVGILLLCALIIAVAHDARTAS